MKMLRIARETSKNRAQISQTASARDSLIFSQRALKSSSLISMV